MSDELMEELLDMKARAEKAESACAHLQDEIGNLRERATHAEQAALEMAEKIDELKAENQLMRESLQRIATNPSSIASQHIARETLDKLKGQ